MLRQPAQVHLLRQLLLEENLARKNTQGARMEVGIRVNNRPLTNVTPRVTTERRVTGMPELRGVIMVSVIRTREVSGEKEPRRDLRGILREDAIEMIGMIRIIVGIVIRVEAVTGLIRGSAPHMIMITTVTIVTKIETTVVARTVCLHSTVVKKVTVMIRIAVSTTADNFFISLFFLA